MKEATAMFKARGVNIAEIRTSDTKAILNNITDPNGLRIELRRAAAGVDASPGDESLEVSVRDLIPLCAAAGAASHRLSRRRRTRAALSAALAKPLPGTTIVVVKGGAGKRAGPPARLLRSARDDLASGQLPHWRDLPSAE
jgi:hypothetical protein